MDFCCFVTSKRVAIKKKVFHINLSEFLFFAFFFSPFFFDALVVNDDIMYT